MNPSIGAISKWKYLLLLKIWRFPAVSFLATSFLTASFLAASSLAASFIAASFFAASFSQLFSEKQYFRFILKFSVVIIYYWMLTVILVCFFYCLSLPSVRAIHSHRYRAGRRSWGNIVISRERSERLKKEHTQSQLWKFSTNFFITRPSLRFRQAFAVGLNAHTHTFS